MHDRMVNRVGKSWWLTLIGVVFWSAAAAVAGRSLDSFDIIFDFRGQDSAAHLGEYLNCVGDINSDGFSDIAISSWDYPADGGSTYVFFGGNPPDCVPDMLIEGGWGPPAAIDLGGDGVNEVIASTEVYFSFPCEEGTIYFYQGYADSIGSVPYSLISPDTGNWAFGWDVRTGFVDSDSLGDMLVLKYCRPSQELVYYSGAPTLDTVADWSYVVSNSRQSFDDGFGFIDFNGDGQLDIFAAQIWRDPGFISTFFGPTFGSVPDLIIDPPVEFDTLDQRIFGRGTYNIGDFDGDGWDDLGVIFALRGLIYKCGPSADTLYDYHLEASCQYMAAAGDVNGDGYNDVITGGSYTMDGSVQVYLGGTEADTTFDLLIVRTDLPPFFLQDVGYRLSTAGDFNGDGIDDFMFSCRNFSGGQPGAVFVIRGSSDIVTSVDDRTDPAVPEQFKLMQNHPNPFNGSTNIEFLLRERGQVSLEVFNVLGQGVKVLLDQESAAVGRHVIVWDGTDSADRAVASGVYLYRLSVGNQSAVKKMVLLE